MSTMTAEDVPRPVRKLGAIPTNNVVYMGKRVPARIDPEARVGQIVEVMSQVFGTKEHPITLCLRDELDNLVTQSNLPSKVIHSVRLKLCPSPASEALFVVHSLKQATLRESVSGSIGDMALRSRTSTASTIPDLPLKLALFNLQKHVKEEDFAAEFLLKGGVRILVHLLQRLAGGLSGNALAYALQGLRGLLEYEAAWPDLTDILLDRVLHILVSAAQPNILRPATSIIRRLLEDPDVSGASFQRDRSEAMLSADAATWLSKGKGKEVPGSSRILSFDGLWRSIERMNGGDAIGFEAAEALLTVVASRLKSQGDLELVSQSLGLINAMLKAAYNEGSSSYPLLARMVDKLEIRHAVLDLMRNASSDLLEPQVLAFQARHATILHSRRMKRVHLEDDEYQQHMLAEILGGLSRKTTEEHPLDGNVNPGESSRGGWTLLGVYVDEAGAQHETNSGLLCRGVGELGLECLHYLVIRSSDYLGEDTQTIANCAQFPLGQASAECVLALCEQYALATAMDHSPSAFQPFLLDFDRLHLLVLRFFRRRVATMWEESQATSSDFHRVASLVRSHLRVALIDEATKTWDDLERDLLQADYREIRDAQMEAMERDGGMTQRPAIRRLREKLAVEAGQVVIRQRIGCMLQGSWFNAAVVAVSGVKATHEAQVQKPLRFIRLSSDRKTLAWADFATRPELNPSAEQLRERVDMAAITSVRLGTGRGVKSLSGQSPSKLSFSLMSGQELSLLDMDAIHAAQMAEWTDGLRYLIGAGGLASAEGKEYAHVLTELAIKVRLLDLTGDGVEVPEKIKLGPAPESTDFWFAK